MAIFFVEENAMLKRKLFGQRELTSIFTHDTIFHIE